MRKMRRRTQKDELLDVARKMPPVRHTSPDGTFDWGKSEAAKWLISQPEILDYVWQCVHNRGEALITYDRDTGTWRGVDYHD